MFQAALTVHDIDADSVMGVSIITDDGSSCRCSDDEEVSVMLQLYDCIKLEVDLTPIKVNRGFLQVQAVSHSGKLRPGSIFLAHTEIAYARHVWFCGFWNNHMT